MEKEYFKEAKDLIGKRIVILKGNVYENRGSLIMAMETTCNFTKDTFKGVFVGSTGDYESQNIQGDVSDWFIDRFADEKTKGYISRDLL